jgi:hypothetical protein
LQKTTYCGIILTVDSVEVTYIKELVFMKKTKYFVNYPGQEGVIMEFFSQTIKQAKAGNAGRRRQIIFAYREKVKAKIYVEWNGLEITTSSKSSGAKPQQTVKSSQKVDNKPLVREKYGCNCDCPACDQGHHKSCKYGCKCGQYI